MGRVFATIYRILLMGLSISAVALSILAATSCSFLDFVHPYTSDGRSLTIEATDGNKRYIPHAGNVTDQRIIQKNDESEGSGIVQEAIETPNTVGLVPTDYLAQLADSLASNMSSATSSASKNASKSRGNQSFSTANGNIVNMTQSSNEPQSGTSGLINDTAVNNATDSQVLSKVIAGNTTMPTNFNDTNATNLSHFAPSAIRGSAGLFCAPNDDSIYDVWKQTFIDSGAINENNTHDESEDLARNGAVVSSTFGSLVAFILVVETLLGSKIFCEKWIVSLLALSACISQGMTFLFFNSDRYCDANIIHEILEQDPCVVGTGAIMSILALIMYACVIILMCHVPQHDPYHLLCCCRSQKDLEGRKTGSLSSLEMVEDSHSGGGLSGTNTKGTNVAMSGRDHASAPQWLSEQEENEII